MVLLKGIVFCLSMRANDSFLSVIFGRSRAVYKTLEKGRP